MLDDAQQSAELRQAFINHLPRRIELVQKRAQRLARGNFDINAIVLLTQEVRTLAGTSGKYGLVVPGERLFALEQVLDRLKQNAREFTDEDRSQLEHTARALSDMQDPALKTVLRITDVSPRLEQLVVAESKLLGRYSTPPSEYWRRFGAIEIAAIGSTDAGFATEPRDGYVMASGTQLSLGASANDDMDNGTISIDADSDFDSWNGSLKGAELSVERPDFSDEDLAIVQNAPVAPPVVEKFEFKRVETLSAPVIAAPVALQALVAQLPATSTEQAKPIQRLTPMEAIAAPAQFGLQLNDLEAPVQDIDESAIKLARDSSWSIETVDQRPASSVESKVAANLSLATPANTVSGAIEFDFDDGHQLSPMQQPTPDLTGMVKAEVTKRVFYLSDEHAAYASISDELTHSGLTVDRVESVEELIDTLSSITADLVLIDQRFVVELDAIGDFLKTIRTRTNAKMPVVAFAEITDLAARLRALRLGIDTLLAPTLNGAEVMARLQDLLSSSLDAPYRILIVEDDRSQALFAESILRKSNMDVLVVLEPFQTIAALEQYKPDLILMDLYMPGIDGIELTSIIRERDEFVSTPIVFLSGEQDSDKQYDAINAGGDDFLAKPIRPKHLISSVTNRARRARALRERKKSSARDSETGLFDRSFLIDRMTNALIAEDRSSVTGGLLLIEMFNVEVLKLELGVDALEHAMRTLARKIATLLQANEFAARFGEASLGVLSLARDVTTIDAHMARVLIDFKMDLAVTPIWRSGCARFENRLVDASQMLNAAHRQMAERSRLAPVLNADLSGRAALVQEANARSIPSSQSISSAVGPDASPQVARSAVGQSISRASDDALAPIATVHPPLPANSSGFADATIDSAGNDFAQAIRNAIRNDEFQVLFEPIVALQGGNDAQFELLLRYCPMDGDVISHSELHARTIEHGQNSDIDRWLLNKALATLDERSRAGKSLSKLFVAQSVESLRDPSRIGWLRQSMDTRRITSTGLYLAFRMNDVVRELKHAIVFFQSARQQGIRIVLDHFESTLTTLQLLSYLPIDAVKLSSRYLDPATNLRDELLTLVNAAHAGGKHVVAARVEDAKLAASLWSVGVDYIQGNFVQSAGREMSFDFQSSVI